MDFNESKKEREWVAMFYCFLLLFFILLKLYSFMILMLYKYLFEPKMG